MRAFLADTASDANEKAVDRLLASPHYAEQRTMHWLDAVRYGNKPGSTATIQSPRGRIGITCCRRS